MASRWTFSRRAIAALVAVLFGVSGFAPSEAAAQTEAATEAARGKPALSVRGKFIDQMVAEFMAKHDVPGMTMAIVQAPYIPRSAGYGRASLSDDELASTRTMWNIGPLTQAFTAVAVFQLYEAKKLDIRAAIGKLVPDLPAAWGQVTVFDLLQHASGIADYRSSPDFKDDRRYKPAELLALVSTQPLLFKTGTQVRMSATDFLLLGLIIERAGGVSFHDFITRHQIEPLGLRATMFAEDFAIRSFPDRPHKRFTSEVPFVNPVEPAVGYRDVAGKLVAVDPKASETFFAYGSLWSSAEDISAWDIALAGGILVRNADNRALIYKPTTLANGAIVPAMAGWEFTRHPGFMEIKGSSPGFSAYLSRFTAPSDLVCVTLLANKEGLDLTGLARDIAEAYKADLGADVGSASIVTRESKFPVDETVARLEARLAALKIPVFATFDHADNARKVGMELRPTRVIVFGNPQVGTRLMQDRQAIALDLPLRLSVWEDGRKRVWVSYPDMGELAGQYGVKDKAVVAAMERLLAGLVAQSTDVYGD
jgi:CubicO group peptidase (beta-lactamase class C family)/uncharacterized protein (DUF302 family)